MFISEPCRRTEGGDHHLHRPHAATQSSLRWKLTTSRLTRGKNGDCRRTLHCNKQERSRVLLCFHTINRTLRSFQARYMFFDESSLPQSQALEKCPVGTNLGSAEKGREPFWVVLHNVRPVPHKPPKPGFIVRADGGLHGEKGFEFHHPKCSPVFALRARLRSGSLTVWAKRRRVAVNEFPCQR